MKIGERFNPRDFMCSIAIPKDIRDNKELSLGDKTVLSFIMEDYLWYIENGRTQGIIHYELTIERVAECLGEEVDTVKKHIQSASITNMIGLTFGKLIVNEELMR